MKYLLLAILMFVAGESWGQVKVETSIDSDGDTSIVVKDTLSVLQMSKKNLVPNTRVTLRITKGKEAHLYRLFINFKNDAVYSITSKNTAEFTFLNGSILSLPYDGSDKIYSSNEIATFSIDIEKSMDTFKNNPITRVYLGTSDGGYAIDLTDRFQQKISEMVKAAFAN